MTENIANSTPETKPKDIEITPANKKSKLIAASIHFSLFIGLIFNHFGLTFYYVEYIIFPILIWALTNDDPFADSHGKSALDFIIAAAAYFGILILAWKYIVIPVAEVDVWKAKKLSDLVNFFIEILKYYVAITVSLGGIMAIAGKKFKNPIAWNLVK